MKNLPIKAFSFVDFFENDWEAWKLDQLFEAKARAREKKAKYAFAGNQSKAPILWDEDDWRYLSQFPPEFWTRAIQYRYNLGLLRAAQIRMEDPQHSLQAVPNEVASLEFYDEDGSKVVFRNVYVGFRNLMEKLEKPVRTHKGHNSIPGVISQDDPGLDEIDPDQKDATHPSHPSKYKYGLHDFDLTYPLEVPDEYFDALPDEEINLPPDQERNATNIAKKRKEMKKAAQHSFQGMSVLQAVRASTHMGNWIRAQALGLLGQAPTKIKDPNTGEEHTVDHSTTPTVANKDWPGHTGKADDSKIEHPSGSILGKVWPLSLPTYKKKIKYERVNAAGKSTAEEREYSIPVLLPGKILPQVQLSLDQRRVFAKRSGFDISKCGQGLTWDTPWQEVEAKCKAAKAAGQVDDLANLLRNYDILTPEQRAHLIKNQRTGLHYAKSSRGSGKKDPYAGELNYAVGFRPNKTKRGIVPADLPPEKMKIVADKYFPIFWEDADKGVSYFIKWATQGRKLHSAVLDVLDKIQTDLTNVAAAFMVMNINHPKMGVYDAELGLNNVNPEADEKLLKDGRKYYAFNFAKDLSQAAFGDIGSRRQREKMGTSTVSIDAPMGSGADATSMAGNLAQQGMGSENLRQWYTRRLQLNPATEPIEDPETGAVTYPIARLIWNVPKIDHEIDKFFDTRRNIIQAKLGGTYASMADKLRDKMKTEIEALKMLYNQAVEELIGKGVNNDEELERQSRELVKARLKDKLVEMRPDLYGNVSDKDIEAIAMKGKDVSGADITASMETEFATAMDEFWERVLSGGEDVPLPLPDPESGTIKYPVEMSIDDFANMSLKNLVGKLLQHQGEQILSKWIVRVWMGINKYNGTPITQDKAITDIEATGLITPAESKKAAPAATTTTAASGTVPVSGVKKNPKAVMNITEPEKSAATNITALFADLKTNWKDIVARKAELSAVANEFRTAVQQFRASINQRRETKQQIPVDELMALVKLGQLAEQI
jgi:hypothetical protein